MFMLAAGFSSVKVIGNLGKEVHSMGSQDLKIGSKLPPWKHFDDGISAVLFCFLLILLMTISMDTAVTRKSRPSPTKK
jgi:hypothetical protein